MRKTFVILIVIFIFIASLLFLSRRIIYSYIPGWNTTIVPSYILPIFAIVINFIVPFVIYKLLKIAKFKPNENIFYLHALVSTLIIVASDSTQYLFDLENPNEAENLLNFVNATFIVFTVE